MNRNFKVRKTPPAQIYFSPIEVSFPCLNALIRGKRAVTPDTALRLARVLGMPADFWLGLQLDWDLWHAMRGEKAAEIAHLEPVGRTA
ncbi:MAG: HigA family addiction module antidote protein [Candidatus Tectomicrobia bacterium]|uniref:HigA family addiction module antidote protein n=1 Tax=Tectimicrobiota bacterium TaxID=2528274 RepID=A0A932GS12_UNCTE|nr:HigA family addiction module antidote protein [Candidatus Tectomicrobia bacterium]